MKHILIAIIVLSAASLSAQKIFTKTGEITFYSDAPVEKIEAVNHKASSVIDTETGAMQWSVLIKAFSFEKALMEEHFNENYMESSKYPKGTFKGKIENLNEVDFSKNGKYNAVISGTLEIHGVAREVKTSGQFIVSEKGISGTSEFKVVLSEYGIQIPSVVVDNISKTVDVSVKAQYQILEQ
jgi:polyisoprenoid-binding protein YceI